MTSSTTNRTDAARTAGPVTTSATAGAGIAGAATVLMRTRLFWITPRSVRL